MFKVNEFGLKTLMTAVAAASIAAVTLLVTPLPSAAQTSSSGQNVVIGERYVPTIWVDPDGCEHWVMDDGAEG